MEKKVNHIIIRPHPNDINIFEEVLEFLPKYLDIFDEYLYTIEKDNTPERHCHLIVFHDFERIDNKLRKLKEFIQEKIKNRNSLLKRFIVTRNPKTLHDKKMVLGYVIKDLGSVDTEGNSLLIKTDVRHTIKNKSFIIDNVDLLLECYNYYQENQIKQEKQNYKDIISINKNTAIVTILNYINQKRPNHTSNDTMIYPELFDEMVHNGYSFLNISRCVKRDLYLELKIHMEEITTEEKRQFCCEYIKNPDDGNTEQYLLYIRETQQYDLLLDWYKDR